MIFLAFKPYIPKQNRVAVNAVAAAKCHRRESKYFTCFCHLGEQLLCKAQLCECCPGSSLLLVVAYNPPLTWRQTPLLASILSFYVYIYFFVHQRYSPVLGTSSIPVDKPVTAIPVRNKHPAL